LDNGSRMTQECHVRFCERLKVKFHGPTYLDVSFEALAILVGGLSIDLCIKGIFYSKFPRFCSISPTTGTIWAQYRHPFHIPRQANQRPLAAHLFQPTQ